MSKDKPVILIIDDEWKNGDQFRVNHGIDYEIKQITFTDMDLIKKELQTTYSGENKPALILTDLKHEIKEADSTFKNYIKDEMKILKKWIDEISLVARYAYNYYGIDVLRIARQLYGSDLPMAFYNGFGAINEYNNSILHEEVVALNGDWFQMRLGAPFETMKVNQLLKRNSQYTGDKQPFILFIFQDDHVIDKSVVSDFKTRHKGKYKVKSISTTDLKQIESMLKKKYSGDNQPDVILQSLRYVKDGVDQKIIGETFKKGKDVRALVEYLNKISGAGWGFHGIQVIETVREVYKDNTPVAIYTGLGTITEHEHSEIHMKVVEQNCDWFQKNLGKSFEDKKIKQLLNRK